MSALSTTSNTPESNSHALIEAITGNWGIDTVKLTYDVDPSTVDTEHVMWKRKSTVGVSAEVGETTEFIADAQFGDARARVSLSLLRGCVTWEFEAGQLAGLDRPMLLPPDALEHLVRPLIEQYEHVFRPSFVKVDEDTGEMTWANDWAAEVQIRRLDVTRDIAVPRNLESAFKEALASINPRYSRGVAQRYDNRDGGFTYYNPSGTQGTDRVYNKDAQMNIQGDSLFVRYRVEAEMKRERLKRLGMETLAQVCSERVWMALESRWKALRLDQPLPNRSQVMERLAQLDLEQQIDAMAYLGFKTYSTESRLPRRRMTAIRRALREVGLNPRKGLMGQPCTLMRLGLEDGLLIEENDGRWA